MPPVGFEHTVSAGEQPQTYAYKQTFKIAPTCFDPKIIFKRLHCSLLKLHFFLKKHSLFNFLTLTRCCGSMSRCVKSYAADKSVWLSDSQAHSLSSSHNLCSPKDSDDTRCCVNTIVLPKMSTIALETCRGIK